MGRETDGGLEKFLQELPGDSREDTFTGTPPYWERGRLARSDGKATLSSEATRKTKSR